MILILQGIHKGIMTMFTKNKKQGKAMLLIEYQISNHQIILISGWLIFKNVCVCVYVLPFSGKVNDDK